MALQVSILGVQKLSKTGENLKKASQVIRDLAYKAAGDFASDAQTRITDDFLSGPRPEKLGVVTGRLRSSIKYAVNQSGDELSIKFGSSVPYAAIHEFGGETGSKKGRFTMKKRPFLTPGIEAALPKFKEALGEILLKVANGVVDNG